MYVLGNVYAEMSISKEHTVEHTHYWTHCGDHMSYFISSHKCCSYLYIFLSFIVHMKSIFQILSPALIVCLQCVAWFQGSELEATNLSENRLLRTFRAERIYLGEPEEVAVLIFRFFCVGVWLCISMPLLVFFSLSSLFPERHV